MHTDWKTSLNRANQFNERIKRILGSVVLNDPTLEQYRKEATDLIMFKADGARIACRVREPGYLNFWDDVTITCRRETGRECEYHKMILGGMGDFSDRIQVVILQMELVEFKERHHLHVLALRRLDRPFALQGGI